MMWYTIKAGDSLSLISQKYLGSLMLFSEIYNQNRDVISDPNIVIPGMRIWIPVNGVSKPSLLTDVFTSQPVSQPSTVITSSPYTATFPQQSQIQLTQPSPPQASRWSSISEDKLLLYGGIGLAVAAVVLALV